ncbi:MAG: hypothetical protein GYB26_14515 [Gammaproteobacteria bacterium]|nr:hypothetical protein [Gammaproteobacteria bacterium]
METHISKFAMVRLSEYAEIKPGFAFKSDRFTDKSSDIPLVKGDNVQQGYIDWTKAKFWNSDDVDDYRDYLLEPGDIVVAMDRPWVNAGLKWAFIKAHDPKCLLVQRVARLRAKRGLSQGFLRYLVSSKYFASYIEPIVTGVNVPHISGKQIGDFRIPLPEIDIQQKVAALLATYDDLIENNKRRITLLENMAEEIYREWFVRFRFPGWQEAEFEKGLPASWAVAQGDDLFEVIKGKSYSSEEISDQLNGGRPFINLKNFNRGGGYRDNGLKYFRGEFRDRQQVNRGDVVMAVTDMTQNREVIGRAARVPYLGETDGIISLDVVKISAFSWPDLFTYAHLRYSGISEALKELANGANVLHLKPDLIGKQKYLVPDTPTVEKFVKLIEPLYEQIEKLEQQIQMLECTKNQLLPRLISGKLSVENLNIQFPPSMQSDSSDSADEAAA